MKNLYVLITAGPTREYLDPVRYISNDSSGRMGFALAAAAKKLGADVTLIAGPVSLESPKGVRRIDVVSAGEMRRKVMKRFGKFDVIIMSAAVSDFRPEKYSKQKIKTPHPHPDPPPSRGRELQVIPSPLVGEGQGEGAISNVQTIKLIRNPDILLELGKKKRSDQLLIGFAVETKNLEGYARKKLKDKKCDWIVANRHTVIGKEKGHAILLSKDGKRIVLPELPKDELAFIIFSHIFIELRISNGYG